MNHKIAFTLLIPGLALAACAPAATPNPAPNIANPASVHCEQNGGKLEIRTDEAGNQSGVCVFPDGSQCDEWAYFRDQCGPGQAPPQTPQAVSDVWKTYHNQEMGFSFQYPADATVLPDENGYTVYVNGPLVDNNLWPSFVISYPRDRQDYHVPEGADLRQWLIDHNMFLDQPQPDLTIAGTTAIHTRYPRGQQSFASDHFYFVHDGQLLVITIMHTGDKEDWGVYDRFLQSIRFD